MFHCCMDDDVCILEQLRRKGFGDLLLAIYCRSMSSNTATRSRVCWVSTSWKMDEHGGFQKWMIPKSPWVSILKWSNFWMIWGTYFRQPPTDPFNAGRTRCSSSGENRLRRLSHLLSRLALLCSYKKRIFRASSNSKCMQVKQNIKFEHIPDQS